MTSILVTGGAGFIGSHTVAALIAAGYRPVIVDNLENSKHTVIERLEQLTETSIAFYEQDFRNSDALAEVIKQESVAGVIHFAAFKAVNESINKPLDYYANNVSGFIGLLRLAEQTGMKHIVFSSSATVYGDATTLPVDETAPFLPPTSPYGASKQMDELILRDSVAISEHSNGLALRYFNPIGAHPSGLIGELPLGTPNNLVPLVTQAAAGLREQLTVYGINYDTPDGSCIRDYVHVMDVAEAHVKALSWLERQKPRTYEAINIGTGSGHSVLEVLTTFEKVSGVNVPYKVGDRREGDSARSFAQVTKAEQLLDWKSSRSLETALMDAWNWQLHLVKPSKSN